MTVPDTPLRRLALWAKRRKVTVGIGVWALVVVVFAFVSPSVTIREQTLVADAFDDLNGASGDAAGLLTGTSYSYSVGELTAEDACSITPVRAGEAYTRTVKIYAPEDEVNKTTQDLVKKLRDRYSLSKATSPKGTVKYFGENAGFVEFELLAEDNTITWTASTGCRPVGDPVAVVKPVYDPPAEAAAIMKSLKTTSVDWNLSMVDCGDLGGPGGTAQTVTGTARMPKDAKPDISKLAEEIPKTAKVLLSQSDLVSYRMADTSWTASLSGRDLTVSSTMDCSG